ncbi:hypothetical protein EVAR_77114_1 [Eumeta japonica]|uniref:Uncharacterized protein n=1 Tax=Eumeta variegata TaxID=151549 RepID=A0A4C1T1R7_EUMVA|nr:hypothetical protein EVAR_77114_1 [Eumeta japonica]
MQAKNMGEKMEKTDIQDSRLKALKFRRRDFGGDVTSDSLHRDCYKKLSIRILNLYILLRENGEAFEPETFANLANTTHRATVVAQWLKRSTSDQKITTLILIMGRLTSQLLEIRLDSATKYEVGYVLVKWAKHYDK